MSVRVWTGKDCSGISLDFPLRYPYQEKLFPGQTQSFQLLGRGLTGKEQLDISRQGSDGDVCSEFITSFWSPFDTSCHTINTDCIDLWVNSGHSTR